MRDRHVDVWRNYVHMIWLNRCVLPRLGYPHVRGFGQQLGQDARVRRIQMLNEHESHPGIARQRPKQLRECFQAAGRSSDRDNRKGTIFIGRSRNLFHVRFLSGFGLWRRRFRSLAPERALDARLRGAKHEADSCSAGLLFKLIPQLEGIVGAMRQTKRMAV